MWPRMRQPKRSTTSRTRGSYLDAAMTDVNPGRTGMTASEVALLGEREALQRLELLTTVSSLLETAVDDYDEALDSVAEVCVSDGSVP